MYCDPGSDRDEVDGSAGFARVGCQSLRPIDAGPEGEAFSQVSAACRGEESASAHLRDNALRCRNCAPRRDLHRVATRRSRSPSSADGTRGRRQLALALLDAISRRNGRSWWYSLLPQGRSCPGCQAHLRPKSLARVGVLPCQSMANLLRQRGHRMGDGQPVTRRGSRCCLSQMKPFAGASVRWRAHARMAPQNCLRVHMHWTTCLVASEC